MTIAFTVSGGQAVAATGPTLGAPDAVYEACGHIRSRSQEHLLCFTLTARRRLIACHTVSIGTLTASLVHPREVFRPAILDNAAAVLLAHNHPSGDCTPSAADLAVTRTVARAGELLGIELLDHLVVSASGYESLRASHASLFAG